MNGTWILSKTETDALREADDAPMESTVFRKGDLIAMTYCDPNKGLWHLMLSVQHNSRQPDLPEILDACSSLLPNIAEFHLEAGLAMERGREWLPPVPIVHLVEQRHEELLQ